MITSMFTPQVKHNGIRGIISKYVDSGVTSRICFAADLCAAGTAIVVCSMHMCNFLSVCSKVSDIFINILQNIEV